MNFLTMAPTYGAVASALASIELFRQGARLELAAPLAGVAVFLLVLRFALDGRLRRPTLGSVRRSGLPRKAATFAVVGLVISTAALGGLGGDYAAVQTAEAGYFDNCQFSDSLTLSMLNSFGVGTGQDCTFWTEDAPAHQISETDRQALAESMQQHEEDISVTTNNTAQDRFSTLMMHAKISIVNSLNDGDNETVAISEAKEKVDNYTTRSQQNILETSKTRNNQLIYLASTSATVEANYISGGGYTLTNSTAGWVNYSLANGTVVQHPALMTDGGALFQQGFERADAILRTDKSHTSSQSADTEVFNADNPTEYKVTINGTVYDYEDPTVANRPNTRQMLHVLGQQRNTVNSNIDALVPDIYAAYAAGDISTTDLLGPGVLVNQASTDLNTTGYYGYAAAQLAALGIDGNVNHSHQLQTTFPSDYKTPGQHNVSGTLFYTGSDGPSLDTGAEIDPSAHAGHFYVAASSVTNTTTGNDSINGSEIVYLNQNFTILSATNTQTGESVNTTTMVVKDYSSTNASDLEAELNTLRQQRDFYERQAAAASGSGSSTTSIYVIGAAVLLGAGAMARRKN